MMPDKHRQIMLYFACFVLLSIVSITILFHLLNQRQRAENAYRVEIERFHLPGVLLTQDIFDQLVARRAIPGGEAIQRTEQRIAQAADYLIIRHLRALADLYERHEATSFSPPLHRARIAFGEAQKGSNPSMSEERWQRFRSAIQQCDRLHAVNIDRILHEMHGAVDRANRTLFWSTGCMFLAAGGMACHLMVLVRRRLREQQKTQVALRESEQRLHHSTKLQAVGTLVGGVAHDFNNCLQAIIVNARFLVRKQSGESRIVAEEIIDSSTQAATLVRRLLTFSRHEPIDRQAVRPDEVIRKQERLLGRLLRDDIRLEVECGAGSAAIEIDPVHFDQVLMNLAVNAQDAMRDGGSLTIRTASVKAPSESTPDSLKPGSYVHIAVEDDGIGMEPEVGSRIFEPFFSTKDPGHGTGLGLAMVHGIIARSSGEIHFETVPGIGTRFDIYLPCCEHPDAAHDQPVALAEPPAFGNSNTETILVVEDEQAVVTAIVKELKNAGYKVASARNGAAAVALLETRNAPVDLVLTDVIMPSMRGDELAKRVRAMYPETRIVFMSGYANDDVERALTSDPSPVLQKPFEISNLLAVLRSELDDAAQLSAV